MTKNHVTDLTIVGGGPVGMFAAYYAGLRHLSVRLLETLPVLGGQVAMLYPENEIYDIAGLPKVLGKDLIANLNEQLKTFPCDVHLDTAVDTIEKEGKHFKITTTAGTFYARAVLMTTGQGSFTPRPLNVPGAEAFEGKNLHYFVKELESFRDREVAVLGGGDSAVEWATLLERVAKKVTLVHRRKRFRAHEAFVHDLFQSQAQVLTPYKPVKAHAEDGRLAAITFQEVRGDGNLRLAADEFVVSYGFAYSGRELERMGVETDAGQMVVDSTLESSIPGIFGAGDVATYPGKAKLIAAGFGEAPTAINSIVHYLYPERSPRIPRSNEVHLPDSK